MYSKSYNSGYSTDKMRWSAKKMHQPKQKGCDYCLKMVFFFSSLIQSLIIISLVLFLVYGQPEQMIEEKRVQDLEESCNKLRKEKSALEDKAKNLTKQLNITVTSKMAVEKERSILKDLARNSSININTLNNKLRHYEIFRPSSYNPCSPTTFNQGQNCAYMLQKSEEMLRLVKANFTEQMSTMKLNFDNSQRDKLRFQLEAILLRREKTGLEERIKNYEQSCKKDFVQSLQGIPNVTREFLKKVDDLFMKHESFQLTCEKQSTKLEDIRVNCSSLSREVENKLQAYLDKVGSQVSSILNANAKYQTENKLVKEDVAWCKGNLSATVDENQKTVKQAQLKHDQETEKLLMQIRQLTEKSKLHDQVVSVKDLDISILHNNINKLNMSLTSCLASQKIFGPYANVRSNPMQWPGSSGSQTTEFGSIGQNTAVLSNVGSSGTNLLARTGLSGSTVLNSARTSGTSMIRTSSGTSVSDQQISAQITQHLRELQRYTKTD